MCAFMREEEKKLIDYTVGASMMEPDVREVTNKKGFCKKHFNDIFNTPNKLSCALVTQTHMEEIIKNLKLGNEKIEKSEKGFFKKKDGFDTALLSETADIEKLNSSCAVCDRLDDILDKFLQNLIYLYETEPEFKEKFLNSKGFCLPHFEKAFKVGVKTFERRKKREICARNL
ncbi:MAG: DUF6062 family protein [Clostridiales bacterium]|nr:MAG: DUF6062 family protein [Clostridiales bacterium]